MEIALTDSPLISEPTRAFAQNVFAIGNQIMQMAKNNNYKEFDYYLDSECGHRVICISPCCYDGKTLEYFLTNDDAVCSDSTVYRLASNVVKLNDVERKLEQEKERLQEFYEKKIMPCEGFPFEFLTEEEKTNRDTFSDWHKELYRYRPRGEDNECRKIVISRINEEKNEEKKKRNDYNYEK
jgi:hypothetical protein